MKLMQLSLFELNTHTSTQLGTMQDECVILRRTIVRDSTGASVEVFEESDPVPCGWAVPDSRGDKSAFFGNTETEFTRVDVRLPYGTDIDHLDKVRLVKRKERVISNRNEYEVLGVVNYGIDHIIANLKGLYT